VDYSMMDERMSYNLMNTLNITTGQAVHAKLFLNAQFLGVYAFIEPVDDVFVRNRFAWDANRGRGALYKELWFNSVHMANFSTAKTGENDDAFILEIWAAIQACPLNALAATNLLNKYFYTQPFIDATAFNAVDGDTDDWRERHNFYWYLLSKKDGTKKLWFIPFDYDRLYDSGASTRGPLAGNAWWDISGTATPSACSIPVQSPQSLAEETASPGSVEKWTEIYESLPTDFQRPVTCDKFTQLIALALAPAVRARTLDFLNLITMPELQHLWDVWSAQIAKAINVDPDGPSYSRMRSDQQTLYNHLLSVRGTALKQVNDANSQATSNIVRQFRSFP